MYVNTKELENFKKTLRKRLELHHKYEDADLNNTRKQRW